MRHHTFLSKDLPSDEYLSSDQECSSKSFRCFLWIQTNVQRRLEASTLK